MLGHVLVAAAALGVADPSKPHPHRGVLDKYERVHPSKYGLTLKGVGEDELRSGKPLLRDIKLPNGYQRATSVQDVPAPPEVVWDRIMDLEAYPRMVEGVTACSIYRRSKSGRTQEVYAKYKAGAGPFNVEYFIRHDFEPSKNAMTFCLDYDRLSDFADTVGYWYVEKLEDGWCRVYYSAESKLPGWVPGWAKDQLCATALKRSTSWVDRECKQAMGLGGARHSGGRIAALRKFAMRAAAAAALAIFLKLPLPLVPSTVKLPLSKMSA